jgi:hypothetical protein
MIIHWRWNRDFILSTLTHLDNCFFRISEVK